MGLLQDKINNIKNEYMLYQYIDRSPKLVGDNNVSPETAAFKEMLDKIYERKQILSEILKANQNNTLGEREEELSKQLLESDKYFSSISPEQMENHVSFFHKADDKSKEIPRFQSYQRIYKNLINSAKLQKVNTTVSEATKKMQENKTTITLHYITIDASYRLHNDQKTMVNNTLKQINDISIARIKANEHIKKIDIQKQEIEKKANAQLTTYYNQKANLNKQLEQPKNRLTYLENLQNDTTLEFYESWKEYDKHSKKLNTLVQGVAKYESLQKKLPSMQRNYKESVKNEASPEMKAFMYYKSLFGQIHDQLSVTLPLLKEYKFEDPNMSVADLFNSDAVYDDNTVFEIHSFFTDNYPLSEEEMQQMKVTDLKPLIEKIEKERAEHIPVYQEYCELLSVEATVLHKSNNQIRSFLQKNVDMLIRFDVLPENNLSKQELTEAFATMSDYELSEYGDYIRDKAFAKKPEMEKKLLEQIQKREAHLKSTLSGKDKELLTKSNELDELSKEIETLYHNLTEIDPNIEKNAENMQARIDSAKDRAQKAKLDFSRKMNSFLNTTDLADEFTPAEKEQLLKADSDKVMSLFKQKLEKMKEPVQAQINDTEKQLSELDTKQAAYENEKNNTLTQLTETETKLVNKIQEQTKSIKEGLSHDQNAQLVVDEMIQSTVEFINTKETATNEVKLMLEEEFKEFKKEAQEWLKMAELHKNGHKDSTLFTNMISSVKKFIDTEATSSKMKSVVEELKDNTQKYLDAKNSQHRLIPTDMRKTRMILGNSLKLFSNNVLNTLETVNKLTGMKELETKQAAFNFEKVDEKEMEVKQLEKGNDNLLIIH